MSLRIFALVYIACFATLAMGLYLVKYSVQSVQRDVKTMKTELAREKESLHLLNAEWAYLNRPDRLHRLAQAHLDLTPVDSRRIENMNLLPAAATIDADDELSANALLQPINAVESAR